MRLIRIHGSGDFRLTSDLKGKDIPQYAILSHTWGPEAEEVTFKDLVDGIGKNKAGYEKVKFCAEQAERDGLEHFWVDTCCINKSDNTELSEAINSMFRWYGNSCKCYVYLSDISITGYEQIGEIPENQWILAFKKSRWFTRGWTLQELLAPKSVEFFSREGHKLGNKTSLDQTIHGVTDIAITALRGAPLSQFEVDERFKWASRRNTTREEDWAYSLFGIFDVFVPLIYGEGGEHAVRRLKKAIDDTLLRDISSSRELVWYRKDEGQCYPHDFETEGQTLLGRGAFGIVYKVECTLCHEKYARKVITFDEAIPKAALERHMRDTHLELKCYMTLDHPHIIKYIHHQLGEYKMEIYTEYCQHRDLESFIAGQTGIPPDEIVWSFLESLASALSRCHHGLRATQAKGILTEYSRFEQEWTTILHRDIKPGNVLISVRNEGNDLAPKLGDFGTSFELEDGGNPLSTQQAGTKVYWAPEIAEEAGTGEGRITKWSTKSDIWGVGAVICRILMRERPPQNQAKALNERCRNLQNRLSSNRTPLSTLLAQVICECLDPSPDGRPSALQLLAVALKSDTSKLGLHKSASFWKALSMHSDSKAIFSVTNHFTSQYLPLLARNRTAFNPREVAIIMSLVRKHCPGQLSSCHSKFCAGLVDEFAGYTVFHQLACVGIGDRETIRLAMDDSRWPESTELSHITIKKNTRGFLPSAIALCGRIWTFAERCRSEIAEGILKRRNLTLQRQLEAAANKEFEFMFKMLTSQIDGPFSVPVSLASTAMTTAAQLGYFNVVRKLVELGINPSIRNNNHQTPLHIFAHMGNLCMVRFILDSGAEIQARDRDSRTPLHWAAWAGKHETTRELLRRKADVNSADRHGRTALFGAAGGGYVDVVQLLLSHNADKSIRGGNSNETPLERATKRNHGRVVELLDETKDSQRSSS
ncbi:kinase-like domain-containing protein [Hypoxylon sp. FL1857]|nr:kinase-like domain-containing protein [Hypoxylon sp. FL1857]